MIPGGFYRGTRSDIETFGVRATLVTSSATDEEVVYQLVRDVFEGFDQFKALHPALAQLNKREMIKAALSAPLHPGAERYYREAGLQGGARRGLATYTSSSRSRGVRRSRRALLERPQRHRGAGSRCSPITRRAVANNPQALYARNPRGETAHSR